MKHITITLLLAFSVLKAQVPNGSFGADTSECSNWATSWVRLAGNPEVMRGCNGQVPLNHWGTEASDNDAYMKLVCLAPHGYREFAGVMLESAIDSGDVVSFSIRASHAESSRLFCTGLGIFFGNEKWEHTDSASGEESPHCFWFYPMDTEEGWNTLSCNFIARSRIDRLEIGNTLHFPSIVGVGDSAIYFVDEITLDVTTSVETQSASEPQYLYSIDLLGHPCERDGLRLDVYSDCSARKAYSVTMR